MKTKVLSVVLLGAMLVLLLCACGGGSSSTAESSSKAGSSESTAAESQSGAKSEEEADTVDGELVTFEPLKSDMVGTIVIPEGWSYTHRTSSSAANLSIENDKGAFVIGFSEANVTGLSGATEVEGKTIGGYECRGQTKDKYVEYIGEDIIEKVRLYVYTSTFSEDDMKSPEICSILDSVVVTVN